jgi:hypothetical protein
MIHGPFTLAKFVSKTISDSNRRQSRKSHMTVTTVLALATFGSTTTIRNDPISVVPPKVAKESTVACRCRWHYQAKLCQWKHSFNKVLLDLVLEDIRFFG